ncbi:MAG: hypothetical protein IT559_00470 [Alphaproteobacteria bacterium]|nr:hypothetical protein [Alphaproteobacteria bacterium]
MAKKTEKKEAKKKKRSGAKFKVQIFLIGFLLLSAVFLPTAVLLFISLMPMFAAFFIDTTKKKLKTVTVGAMNMAGCMPFLMELWTSDHTLEKSLDIILDPMAIIVVYAAAGVGYLIDWTLTSLVASMAYQRAISRKKAIEERQAALIERWGLEVNGTIPLDAEGFPLSDTSNRMDSSAY